MTRKENLERCKKLLWSSKLDVPIEGPDRDYLLTEIFPLHKRFAEKKSGHEIRYITVHHNVIYKNRCFALGLDNGELVDISYYECVNRPGLVQDIIAACINAVSNLDSSKYKDRRLIYDWIKTFENEELSLGRYLESGVNGIEFSSEDIIKSFREYIENHV